MFALVLRQSLVVLEIIGIDDLAQRRRVPIFVVEIAVSDDAGHGKFRRQQARGAQLFADAPKIEMLHRALGQVLALGDALRLAAPFDQGAIDATLPQLDRKRDAHGSSADNDDLMPFAHSLI